MLSTQPITILREALQYLENQRVMAPGYRFLQDLVSRVATGERRRITDMLGQAMPPAIEQQLAALLQVGEGMYLISELKHEPKDFSYKALRQEAARQNLNAAGKVLNLLFFTSIGQGLCHIISS